MIAKIEINTKVVHFQLLCLISFLVPENSVRNEEKKILAKLPRRKKIFMGHTGYNDNFILTSISCLLLL